MNETAQSMTLLAVSVGLTFAVGRLLVRAGKPFLEEVLHDRELTRSVNLVLSVLFHLVTLGMLAIVSVLDVQRGDPVQSFVMRLGVVLVVVGLTYGISLLVLVLIHNRRRTLQISQQVHARPADSVAIRSAPSVPNRRHVTQDPIQQQAHPPPAPQPPPADRPAT